jgi:hypothetical protein
MAVGVGSTASQQPPFVSSSRAPVWICAATMEFYSKQTPEGRDNGFVTVFSVLVKARVVRNLFFRVALIGAHRALY